MKYIDLKDKDLAALNAMLKEKKLELFTLRTKQKTMQLTNTNEIRICRREIAQINTAITAATVKA